MDTTSSLPRFLASVLIPITVKTYTAIVATFRKVLSTLAIVPRNGITPASPVIRFAISRRTDIIKAFLKYFGSSSDAFLRPMIINITEMMPNTAIPSERSTTPRPEATAPTAPASEPSAAAAAPVNAVTPSNATMIARPALMIWRASAATIFFIPS